MLLKSFPLIGWHGTVEFAVESGRYAQIRFSELVAELGLFPQQVGILRRLKLREGSSQQEVADTLRVRRSVMVGLVDELEAKGLVERRAFTRRSAQTCGQRGQYVANLMITVDVGPSESAA
jgi:hypothetical protein